MSFDPERFAAGLLDSVREHVKRSAADAIAPLSERLARVEGALQTLTSIADAKKGESVTLDDVMAKIGPAIAALTEETKRTVEDLVEDAEARVLGAIDALPSKGEMIGESVSVEAFLDAARPAIDKAIADVKAAAEQAVSEAVAAIPSKEELRGERGVDVDRVRLNEKGELIFEMSNDIDYNVGDLRGKSVTLGEVMDELRPQIEKALDGARGAVAEAVAAMPSKEELRGEIVTLDDVMEALQPGIGKMLDDARAAVRSAIESLPAKEDLKGDSVTLGEVMDELRPEIEKALDGVRGAVAEAIAAMPSKEDLKGDSVAVEDVVAAVKPAIDKILEEACSAVSAAVNSIPSKDELKGAQGRGIASTVIDQHGALILNMTDNTKETAGVVVGPAALGIDDIKFEYDGERTITLEFSRGPLRKEIPIKPPIPLYRGAWQARAYERGDEVSYRGAVWIAIRDTDERPEASDAWKLCNQRGRAGRSAANIDEKKVQRMIDAAVEKVVAERARSRGDLMMTAARLADKRDG